ncbi:PREDICTED: uncharacterized protein LOC109362813 [Lupinus angustifolius]|uniref:uncharacterized protein LOC109362813 n=1 Tax=Lupinus angustifolius TaxID=3871 RepID=UPI00092EC575|nr:PREDICTED: uncharacterized protein LOC109362813 [Lupinus angustifolius]
MLKVITKKQRKRNHFLSLNTSLASMEEYYYKRKQVPAFGSWDWNDNLPFTQCFESEEQGDLYVTGDLYENHVVTPTMILVPSTKEKVHDQYEKEAKKQNWVNNVKKQLSPTHHIPRPTPKPVDEDLYKISPELLYAKTRKKRGLCFFSSCLLPTCVA